MKRGRILSLFLSIVLLVSVIVPCIQMSVNAEVNTAIDSIETNLNKLKYNKEIARLSHNSDADEIGFIQLAETTTPDEKANFGSKKFTINKENVNNKDVWRYLHPTEDNIVNVIPLKDIKNLYINVSSTKVINVSINCHVVYGYTDSSNKRIEDHKETIKGASVSVPAGAVTKVSLLKDTQDLKAVVDARIAALNEAASNGRSNYYLAKLDYVELKINTSDFSGDNPAELTVGMAMADSTPPSFSCDRGDNLVDVIVDAEDAINSDVYAEESKEALKGAVNDAWAVVESDKKLVVKGIQTLWGKLVKNPELIYSMAAYNKTGMAPNLSLEYNQEKKEGQTNSNYIVVDGKPLNDKAHSGTITTTASVGDEVQYIGSNYTTVGYEAKDTEGTADDNYTADIPSFIVGDVILSAPKKQDYKDKFHNLSVTFYSTKEVKIGYKVWFVPDGGGYSATTLQHVIIPAGEYYTLDLTAVLNNKNLTYNKVVGQTNGLALAIKGFPKGNPGEDDYIKIGAVMGNMYDSCPTGLRGDVSLAAIYNQAKTLSSANYLINSKTQPTWDRFQSLISAAGDLLEQDLKNKFKDEETLISAVKNEIWPTLIKKEPVDVKQFDRYNKTGKESGHSEAIIADGKADPDNLDKNRVGKSDAANSGYAILNSSSAGDKADFGFSYVELTTQKFETSKQEINADASNDIPYLAPECVAISDGNQFPLDDLNKLYFTVDTNKAMTLRYKAWFGLVDEMDKPNRDDKVNWDATGMQEITVQPGKTTIDLTHLVETRKETLKKESPTVDSNGETKENDKYRTEIKSLIYVTVSSKHEGANGDYLRIGNVRGIFTAPVPDVFNKVDNEETEENEGTSIIELYDAMQELNLKLDDYVGDLNGKEPEDKPKQYFNEALYAAKSFADKEWAEVYKSESRLADMLKNYLWTKLANNITLTKEFAYYNRTGLNQSGIDYSYDITSSDKGYGMTSDKSGKVPYLGSGDKSDKYGRRYCYLTTKKVNENATTPNDRDIPSLDRESVLVTLGANDNQNYIDVPNSSGIYFNIKSTMNLTIRMRIWYMKADDTDGKYDQWGLNEIRFSVVEGENSINILDLLKEKKIDTAMKYMHYVTFNICEFVDREPGADDFLEVGSIGAELYENIPKKLNSINSLAAIVREANNLNMDDFVGDLNDSNDKSVAKLYKQMFVNTLNKANEFLAKSNVNLTEHVPIEVYKTNAAGKRSKLSESEFGYEDQQKLFDKNKETDPVVFSGVNDKQLDIIFNLNDKMKLYDIRVYLAEANVKNMKIYTSPVREAIWDEDSFFREFSGVEANAKILGVTSKNSDDPNEYVDENQYVRFSFVEVDGDVLSVTEIECIGKGAQQLAYSNILDGKTEIMGYANVHKDADGNTVDTEYIDFKNGKFVTPVLSFMDENSSHDADEDTIVEFCGGLRPPKKGSRNTKKIITYNIIFSLDGLCAIDNIKYVAGSSSEYFPQEMKFYLGSDEMDILDASKPDTVCVAEFNEATSDGVYNATFLSRNAAYARIELIRDGTVCEDGRYGEELLAVVKEIEVNGLNLNASRTDAVKSFVDAESGIIVDILKHTDGDVYEGVQGMKLTKRKPTDDEVAQADGFDFTFSDWFYTITFLNYKNEPVYDVEGRDIRISIPIGEDEDAATTFMATLEDGQVILLEHDLRDIEDRNYISVTTNDPTSLIFAKGHIEELIYTEEDEDFDDDEEDFDDDEDFEDEDYDDEYDDEEEEEEEEESSGGKRKKYYKVIRRGGGLSTGAIVGIVSGSTVAVAGGALMIIFRKKIFKPRIKIPKS